MKSKAPVKCIKLTTGQEDVSSIIRYLPYSCLLISSLPGSVLRMHVESLAKPRDVNKRSQSLAW